MNLHLQYFQPKIKMQLLKNLISKGVDFDPNLIFDKKDLENFYLKVNL